MRKSFSQLKKDLQKGVLLKTNYNISGKFINSVRKICRTQTNTIIIENNINNEIKKSYLWFIKKSK